MHKSTLVAVALAGAASAANSTVQLFLPGFGTQSLVGSVIASDAAATTYAIACDDPNAEDCGLTSSITITEGPSTLGYSAVAIYDDQTQTIELNCNIINSSLGVCTGTIQVRVSSFTTSTVTTTSFTDASDFGPIPVTITAGAVGSSASTAASTTGSTSSTKGSSSSTQTGSSTGSGSAGAATGSSTSTSVSTGGVPMITQAPWVIGGAAAALAYAAM